MTIISSMDKEISSRDTDEVLFSLCYKHLERIHTGSVHGSLLRSAVERRDSEFICLYELKYDSSHTAYEYANIRQILAFFQKRHDISLSSVPCRRETAYVKFIDAESLCKASNDIYRLYHAGQFCFAPRVDSVFFRAQRKIAEILGDVPLLEDLAVAFGPGATTQVKKKNASARRKLEQELCCSEDMLEDLKVSLRELPLMVGLNAGTDAVTRSVHVHVSKLGFVRKTAKTDRTIAVEPSLNTMFQKGIGSYMALRLRRFGIDIRDQTLNMRLACEGSRTGALATLDLSSASDTVSDGLVRDLLPFDWYLFLSGYRSGLIETPQGILRQEKFSSMGNGFTFPLETLLFYALAFGVCEILDLSTEKVSVYGDDIIIPVEADLLLREVLLAAGFLVNHEKSFSQGPFRESCGKDYYSGISIRPCYIKEPLSGFSMFVLHNFYVRDHEDELAFLVRQFLDKSLLLFGPDGFGDGHLLGDPVFTPHKRKDGWGGYTFETFTRKPIKRFYALGADHVFPAYSVYVRSSAEMQQGIYRTDIRTGESLMQDIVPGYCGYRRIKIYKFG